MNNIEILEEWIKIDRKMRNNSTESDYDKFCEEKCIAIENLIQENKELKEHLQKYYNGELYTAKQLKNIEENQKKYFIHKSKLKEKIEELDKEMAKDEVDEFGIHSQGWAALDWTRDFLLKLLEEGE